MKTLFLLLSMSLLVVKGCGDTTSTAIKPTPPVQPETQPESVVVEETEIEETKTAVEISPYKSLIFNTTLNINPSQADWVLFENGTYILLPSNLSVEQMKKNATVIIKRYKGESLSISKSPLSKGWIAGSSQGIYNYISLDKAGDRLATDKQLKTVGKSSILKDIEELNIVHVNTKK